MSVKRSLSVGRGGSAGAEGKIDRDVLFDILSKKGREQVVFSPADVALAAGAGESYVSRTLLGLSLEGVLQKVDLDRYQVQGWGDMDAATFSKAFVRASKLDATRMRELSEIDRLKKNNDTMRARLLRAQAERDHYHRALQEAGIDPGPLPENPGLALAESKVAVREQPLVSGLTTQSELESSAGDAE